MGENKLSEESNKMRILSAGEVHKLKEDKIFPSSLDEFDMEGKSWKEMKENIISWSLSNPLSDAIIFFASTGKNYGYNPENVYFAGSSVLHKIITKLDGIEPTWKASDNDMFLLKCRTADRNDGVLDGIDMVHMTENTITELLWGFDIPVCRAAMDMNGSYYVSAQCLTAIFTGKYTMPKYMKTSISLYPVMKKEKNSDPYNRSFSIKYDIAYYIKRYYQRVQKYSSRGFEPQYVKTNEVTQWIKNRFSYADAE